MTRTVVGDTIQEDTVKTYTRKEAERALREVQGQLDRTKNKLGMMNSEITRLQAEVTDWTTVITALPPEPELDPEEPVAPTPPRVLPPVI